MVRKRYEIHVWGTVLFLDLGSSSISEAAMDAAVDSVNLPPLLDAELWAYLDRAATAMLNTFDD